LVNATELSETVKRYPWYHTLDLGQGVVTPGMFDHRDAVDRYLIPKNLAGKRCLDVGTMDGFWAFEMERRGADEVVAVDLEDPEKLDWPASLREKITKTLDETKETRFNLARNCLDSRVERKLRSVYELSPDDLGTFDLVFCGDLLVHLKDPITAVERIRSVCRGSAVICTPILRKRLLGKRAFAELDGIDEFQWWLFTMPAFQRLAIAAGFARIEESTEFEMPAVVRGRWKGLRGVIRAAV
jgi:tRNA (mo5U34)-methyltransferase